MSVHTLVMLDDLETKPLLAAIRSAIGLRFREERERLKVSQEEMGSKLGVKRLAIGRYEGGQTAPAADQLAVMHGLGADVCYVVLGERRLDMQAVLQGLAAEMKVVDEACRTLSSELDGVSRLQLAFERFESRMRRSVDAVDQEPGSSSE